MYCDAFFNVCKKLLDPGATCTQKGQCDSKGGKYRCTWGRCFANSEEGSLGLTIPFYTCLISSDVIPGYYGCTIAPLSFECRKTKTQVINLVNYNRRKHCIKPIRLKQIHITCAERGKTRGSASRLVSFLLLIG